MKFSELKTDEEDNGQLETSSIKIIPAERRSRKKGVPIGIASLILFSVVFYLLLKLLAPFMVKQPKCDLNLDEKWENFKKASGIDPNHIGETINGTYVIPKEEPSDFDSRYGKDYSIKDVCKSVEWRKNIYIACGPLQAGTFNVHNSVISCFRRAIDAGIGIILPLIKLRDKQKPWNFSSNMTFDFLFDTDYIKQRFAHDCPQLEIKDEYFTSDTVINLPVVWMHPINTGEMKARVDKRLWQADFDWSNYNTTVLYDGNSFCGWNFADNGANIHKEFYDIFRFNKTILQIAERIVAKLPSEFLGVHLRLEQDSPFVSYGGMTKWLSKLMLTKFRYITTIYVAIGDASIEKEFKGLMDTLGYNVISKWDLTADDPQLFKDVDDLGFDQQAIVDHLALVKSTHLFGVGISTLSYVTGLVRGNGHLSKCDCHLYQPALWNYEKAY